MVETVLAVMEYGLSLHAGEMSTAECFSLVWQRVSQSAVLAVVSAGLIMGLVMTFPPLLPVLAALGPPLAVAGFVMLGVRFYQLGKEWLRELGVDPVLQTLEQMEDTSGRMWSETKDASGRIWLETKDISGWVWDETTDASGRVWLQVKDTSGRLWDRTRDTSGELWDDTKDASGRLWDSTKETSERLWDDAVDTSGELWEDAKETSGNLWDRTKELLRPQE